MIVMKFGGTSLKNAEMFKKSAEIVLREPREKIVVVSAISHITDYLTILIEKAEENAEGWHDDLLLLKKFHFTIINNLFACNQKEFQRMSSVIEKSFLDIGKWLNSIATLRESTPRSRDTVLALGEFLSMMIFSAVLRDLGGKDISVPVPPERIRVNENFGEAEIDIGITKRELSYVKKILKKGIIPVIPGFVGKTAMGDYATLGRNGSDYTAAVIANIFNAEELQIWKEVNGVMQADPKMIPKAKILKKINYEEAMEMSYFGSKVLHPRSISPAIEKQIPIRIKNTYNPKALGTLISCDTKKTVSGVKVITVISDLSTINVMGKGMMGVAGIAERVFGATRRAGANVMMISQASSEYSICFVTQKDDASKAAESIEKEFELEFHHRMLEKVEVNSERSIIAIIGDGMAGRIGVAKKFFTALSKAKVNVVAIAQGSSERNISVLIKNENVKRAVRSVYKAFF